ncbi:MAG: hypothetical protein WCV59_04535 [Parcubacteria group bacterium]|jgi:hypothetical protein
MTKIKIFIVSLALLSSGASFALAQEKTQAKPDIKVPPADQIEKSVQEIATVNIYNTKLVSQDGNRLKISFDLNNQKKIQPGIKYAVTLTKEENGNQIVVAEKIYDETLTLGPGETVKKEVEYLAPKYLDGKFQIWVRSQSDKGLLLALGEAGDINLTGDKNNFVGIAPESCYLNIEGDSAKTKYTILQGVDIAQNENLILNCEMKSNFSTEINVTPNFKTYERTTFGKLLESKNGNQLVFAANEKKSVAITLPKVQKPQAYDLVMTLFDSQKAEISSPLRIHYVLQGASATISGVQLDKDYYVASDTAVASVVWSGSADVFTDSRGGQKELNQLFLEAAINNSSGNACSEVHKETLDAASSGMTKVSIPITSDCADPNIQLAIKDKNGNILDQSGYIVKSKDMVPAEKKSIAANSASLKNLLLILSLLLVLIVILAVVLKKRQRANGISVIIFLIILGMSWMLLDERAQANTFVVKSSCPGNSDVTYTATADKVNYMPGETMKIYGEGQLATCSNGMAWVSGVSYRTSSSGFTQGDDVFYSQCVTNSGCFGHPSNMKTRTVESTPGHYSLFLAGLVFSPPGIANCHIVGYDMQHTGWIDYDVVAPPAVYIGAETNPVNSGEKTNLIMNSGNADWCKLAGGGLDRDIPANQPRSVPTSALTMATNFTFTCGNKEGQNFSSVLVGVAPCTPVYSYSCTTTGGECTRDNCGKSATKSAVCTKTDTKCGGGSSPVAQNLCGSSCKNETITCLSCDPKWKEVAP